MPLRGRRPLLMALAAAAAPLVPALVRAHWAQPEEVIAAVQAPAVRQRFGVTQASRDAALPRLLIIRVGSRWDTAPAEDRRQAAEEWAHLWRSSVAEGIVAILDDATGKPRVHFDARGHAQLKDASSAPAPAAGR